MNAEKLNAWLSLGANVGVVIGLVLLIFEISQNTEMMQAQINQSRTDTALSEQQAVYTSDHVPALLARIDRGEQLTDEDLIRYERFFRAFNRNQDNNLWQYNEGYLEENIPRSIRGAVREVIAGHQLGIATWELQKYSYTAEYVAFVEDAISDLR
jgi:hypothetical protein